MYIKMSGLFSFNEGGPDILGIYMFPLRRNIK